MVIGESLNHDSVGIDYDGTAGEARWPTAPFVRAVETFEGV